MSEVSLKEYVESIVLADSKLQEARFAEHARALNLAKSEIDRRLEEMNQMREQINRERSSYVTRELFDRMHATLEDRVWKVEQFKSNIDGRLLAAGGLFVLIQLALSALAIYLTHKP